MQPDILNDVLLQLLRMIATRLKTAHDLGSAAESCANTGNSEGAFRMLLDIEQPLYEATSLLNTICIARREPGS